MKDLRLSVNVDHVATLRQARMVDYPDPLEAARLAEAAGAAGITVHLRHDRRHIQEHDVRRLREAIRGRLNLEMAATEEMLAIAVELRPDKVSLVPERPEEVTTEGGLDLTSQRDRVARAVGRLGEASIEVALFLDPDEAQIAAAVELSGQISGFEINTDAYTRDPSAENLDAVRRIARIGSESGFEVYAGHGLTSRNVGPIAAIAEIEELNIGHFLIGRAVLVGIEEAVREMLAAMQQGRSE